MPTICCAVGCKHTSGNGYCRLKRFPSDTERSIIWEKNLRRNQWVRRDWELLCECHFHFSQFEKLREDGAKKLKHNAVPTLFPTHTLPLPDVIRSSFTSNDAYASSEGEVNTSASILETLVPIACNFDAYQFESDFVDGIKNLPPDAVPCILSTHTLVQNEVHFEESAFESHRADGLRKLKPNAVPTIHSFSQKSRKQRKQNVKPRDEFTLDESASESLVLAEKLASNPNEEEPIQIAEVYCNQLDNTQIQPPRRKKLKTIHVTEIVNNRIQAGWSEDEELIESIKVYSTIEDTENRAKDSTNKEAKVLPLVKAKRGRPLKKRRRGGNVVNHQSNNSSMAIENQSYRNQEEDVDQALISPDSSESKVEDLTVECFVCNQVIAPGYAVCLNIPTDATRVLLAQRLEMIADLGGMIGPQEVVCTRCASLLNHVDRTEAELTILKGAISFCARGRNLSERRASDPEFANNVQLLDRFESIDGGRHNILSLDELFFIKTEKEDMAEDRVDNRLDAETQPDEGEVEEVLLEEDTEVRSEENDQEEEVDDVAEVLPTSEEPEVIASNECEPSDRSQLVVHDLESLDEPKDKGTVEMKDSPMPDSSTKEVLSVARRKDSIPDPSPRPKVHVCKICNFKTQHDCVMIWHLRMHMRNGRWCDFCNASIPEQESIFSQLKKVCCTKPKVRYHETLIVPAVPVDPVNFPAFPTSPYPLTLIPVRGGSASAPVLLISKESNAIQESAGDSTVLASSPENLEMSATADVDISDRLCISGTSVLPNVVTSLKDLVRKSTEVEPAQKQSPVEVFCRVADSAVEQLDDGTTTLSEAFGVSISDCDSLVGSGVMQSFSSLPEPSGIVESVSDFADEGSQASKTDNLHGGGVFCDEGVDSSFLDTLSSQQAKFGEILPEICDEAAERNIMSISNDTSEGKITNKDVSFAGGDGLGESELAIAYENSVAALMCQSDDSDGILSYH